VREVIVLFHAKDAPISSGHDATAQSASFSKRSLGKSVESLLLSLTGHWTVKSDELGVVPHHLVRRPTS
jgi:hypothetical protein